MASSTWVGHIVSVGAGMSGDGSVLNPLVSTGTVTTVNATTGNITTVAATTVGASTMNADAIRVDQTNHDVGLARSAAGVLKVTDGAAGTGSLVAVDVKGTTFHVGAAAGVDASVVIPAVATLTVTKGIITAVV